MFRIAKAELHKIFHMPLIYFLLILVMASSFIVSLFYDKNVSDINTTPTYTYDEFVSSERKKIEDELTQIDNILKLLEATNTRKEDLYTKLYGTNGILDSIKKLKNTTDNELAITNLNNAIANFKKSILSEQYFAQISLINKIISSAEYTSNITDKLDYIIEEINKLISKNQTDTDYEIQKYNIISLFDNNPSYLTYLTQTYNNSNDFINFTINKLTDNAINAINNYVNNYYQSSSNSFNLDVALELYNEMINKIDSYYSTTKSIIEFENVILVNNELFLSFNQQILNFLNYSQSLLNSNNNKKNHEAIIEKLSDHNLRNLIKNYNNSLIYINHDGELINNINEIKEKTKNNKEILLNKIEANKTSEKVSDLILSYSLLYENSVILTQNLTIRNSVSNLPQEVCKSFYGSNFNNFSKYKLNETIQKQYYFLNTNTYDNSYIAEPTLSFNSADENHFNFIYTSIKLTSIFLIVVMIIFSAILITKDQKSGSIKFMISKPYNRYQIVSGKHLTLFLILSIFIIVALISSFITSSILFGLPDLSNNILLIFNASIAFKVNPILYFILFAFIQILEVFFYTLIASMFAFMFWSILGAVLCSVSSIGSIFLLNYLFKSELWASYLPFYNANLFKYFGSGLKLDTSNKLQEILLSNINSNSTFFISLLIISIYSILIVGITYIINKKRNY